MGLRDLLVCERAGKFTKDLCHAAGFGCARPKNYSTFLVRTEAHTVNSNNRRVYVVTIRCIRTLKSSLDSSLV